jgi:signal transduction histidine kinase
MSRNTDQLEGAKASLIHLFGVVAGVRGRPGLSRYATRLVLVAAAYFGAAKLGLTLAHAQSSITAVWAPTGIALAALLIWGYRLWPAVALGALLANAWTGIPLISVLGITAGNTLEALVGAYLLRRVAGFQRSLESVNDVLALVVFGGVISTMVSATVGVTSLWLGGAIAFSEFTSDWRVWWLGDMGGDLVVAPLLLALASSGPRSALRGRFVEAGAFLVLLVPFSILVFSELPLPYLLFPVFIWSALRFRQVGAAATSFVVAGIAVAFTANGAGPFAHGSPDDSLLLSQGFMGVASVSALLLAAVTSQRQRAVEALHRARDGLEARVRERTTELEGTEEKLRKALATERDAGERLRELDRLKDEFLATVSHELRTPLTAICGFAELMRKAPDHQDQPDWLARISDNASEMGAMIEQLLDYSRLEAGKVSLEVRPLPVREAALHCLDLARMAMDGRRTSLDIPADLEIQADERGFERILVNLLTNAAKYSPEGSMIRVSAGPENGNATVAVQDEGIGIPRAAQPHVFERFYQGPTVPGTRGTGVGLSIVRRYVEMLGGEVWVNSSPGRGSTFLFRLPLSAESKKECDESQRSSGRGRA